MREFDLERAFPGRGAFAEDLEDEAGAVDDLAGPFLFQVALLDRGELGVEDGDVDLPGADLLALGGGLAFAEEGGGATGAQREDGGVDDDEADGGGEADGLGQARLGGAGDAVGPGLPGQDDRGAGDGGGGTRPLAVGRGGGPWAVSRRGQWRSPGGRG
jgi:hypothetical protein